VPIYALTIFLGAFLLFQVQPLIGKFILPWFGGGPGVWTTCLLFFQVALLAGYAYAHVVSRRLRPRKQVLLHLALLAAAVAALPITPGNTWKPPGGGNAVWEILRLLTVCVGLPYLALSSTGPLVQYWYSRAYPDRSPYRLYALSNAGSLLALVSFPFYFEPHFSRQQQSVLWAWSLVAYALSCAACALTAWRAGGGNPEPAPTADAGRALAASASTGPETDNPFRPQAPEVPREPVPRTVHRLLWLLLPACASVLLVAITNKICQDVAVIPFLWILPLALYLLSFIICFDSPRWYLRFPFTLALIAALGGITWALSHGASLSVARQLSLYCSGLFVCCMVCHGELYRLRPAAVRLTEFYMLIAAGGALGGVFVALAAPVLFRDFYELHWGLLLCATLFVCAIHCTPAARGARAGRDSKSTLPCAEQTHSGMGGGLHPPPPMPGESAAREFGAKDEGGGPPPRATPRWWAYDYWRWLACVLPFAVFAVLDRLITLLAQQTPAVPKGYFFALRLGMWGMAAMLVVSWVARGRFRTFAHWRLLATLWLAVGWVALAAGLYSHAFKPAPEAVYKARNFYGVLAVNEYRRDEPEARYVLLQHGRITHGLQFTHPERARWPTTYYGEQSGVGLALNALPSGPRRIGLVGLGTGTLSVYGRKGDYFRIYELNPRVAELASAHFTYLRNCPSKVEVAFGDARLSMEVEPPQQFDLLALDAFSSDAIPVHLLTREAFQLYDRHLKTNGVIAVHISNHFLDLEPVVAALARHSGFRLALIDYDETDPQWWLYSSTWMLLSRDERFLATPEISEVATPVSARAGEPRLWTDDYASLFEILK
jgi:hypothetical protein